MDDLTALSKLTMYNDGNSLSESAWNFILTLLKLLQPLYKASPGAPRYSEVCLVLTTLKMEKRRSALANKDMPCSKQIQKGNIKGHLGDEKGNCCTWQYTYRHIHLGMYTHISIYIPPQICYICFQTLATILPVRCQIRVTQCTVPVLCCSVFPKFYLPHYRE